MGIVQGERKLSVECGRFQYFATENARPFYTTCGGCGSLDHNFLFARSMLSCRCPQEQEHLRTRHKAHRHCKTQIVRSPHLLPRQVASHLRWYNIDPSAIATAIHATIFRVGDRYNVSRLHSNRNRRKRGGCRSGNANFLCRIVLDGQTVIIAF